MHAAASEGTMPNAMSFSGYNFDIVTGFLAIPAAIACRIGAPLKWIAAWNWLGFLTLTGIGVVSFLASPVMQAFGPDQVNRWIAYLPFVWLPTVLVVCAIAGHIVIWRRLCMETG
ncbi:MAG: hypothetical protein GMKNLPBB_00491 [Myxococcota bacterium]|nr:hypothetical protein [Myxococcota bacterium]